MKKCNACGSENLDNNVFCSKCGRVLKGQESEHTGQKPKGNSMQLFIIYGVLILVVLGIVLTRKSWQPFFTQGIPAPAKITYAWHQAGIGNTGFSIDSPVELKPKFIKLPDNVKPLILEMVTYGFTSQPLSIDAVTVTYTGQVVPSLQGAEQGAIANFKKVPFVKDVNYTSKPFSAAGKKGTLLEGTFSAARNSMGFKAVILLENSKMWQVVVIFRASDAEAVEASNKIIASIKIGK